MAGRFRIRKRTVTNATIRKLVKLGFTRPMHRRNPYARATAPAAAPSGASTGGPVINIMKVNKSPIALTKNVTFKWASYVNLSSGANYSSITDFISTRSIYDPNYGITNTNLTNTACPWYTELMGVNPGQYRKYRVLYCDVYVKLRNVTVGTAPMVVIGATAVGGGDYASNTFINNLATRTGHIGKLLQWDEGQDAQFQTWRFRVYPNQVMGLTRAQYNDIDYTTAYNQGSGAEPWIALSVGDSLVDGAGSAAQKVQGNIFIDYHCKLLDPVLAAAE